MLSATATESPGEVNAAAVPLPATALVQDEFVYSETVEPASAVPVTAGLLLFAGEAGDIASPEGATGAVVSHVNVKLEAVATFDTLSVARTVTVYVPSAGKLEAGKLYCHDVVPLAGWNDWAALANDAPFQ